jgi:transcriptional regulator with XRE-family HTH domain
MRPKSLHDRLRRWRVEQQITQHEAARLVGVSQATWSLWESGRCTPRSYTTIVKLAEVTDMTAEEVAS